MSDNEKTKQLTIATVDSVPAIKKFLETVNHHPRDLVVNSDDFRMVVAILFWYAKCKEQCSMVADLEKDIEELKVLSSN